MADHRRSTAEHDDPGDASIASPDALNTNVTKHRL